MDAKEQVGEKGPDSAQLIAWPWPYGNRAGRREDSGIQAAALWTFTEVLWRHHRDIHHVGDGTELTEA